MRDFTTGGIFGAGTREKHKRGQGRANSAGVAELLDADGNIIERTEEPAAEPTTDKPKPKKTAKGKEEALVTEDISAEGAADVSVPLKTVPGIQTVISDDDEPDEERRDIERIWVSSDEEPDEVQVHEDEDEEDVIDRKGKQKVIQRPRIGGAGGLRPVRAPRTLQPTVEDDDGPTRIKGKGKTQKTKTHETIDVDEMDVDDLEFVKEVPSSPELRKKNLKRPAGKSKDPKLATETVEERAERLRVHDDITKLRHIFLPDGSATDSKQGKKKADDQGTLFLMQFPPITPFLLDPSAPPPAADDEVVEVKQETSSAAAQSSTSTAKPPVKKDPDAVHPKSGANQGSDSILTALSTQRLPSGLVGKLNVHQSGKITLDWGGCDMEVRLGTEVGFLQDAVVIQPPGASAKHDAGGDEMQGVEQGEGAADGKGTVYALGQVEGKLVVVPDWGKLYD